MANCFYILVAPSAVGKSDLLRKMQDEGRWVSIKKYSTRDVRYKDGEKDDVVPIDNLSYHGLSEKDAANLRRERIEKIKDICGNDQGFVYYKNGNLYGITVSDIKEGLASNNVVAIISDFETIRRLKEHIAFRNRIIVLYIASSIDERVLLKRFKQRETVSFNIGSEERQTAVNNIRAFSSILGSAVRLSDMDRVETVMPLLNEEWNAVLPYFETIKNRGANISKLYFQYIENIVLIDHAILNFYDLEYMYQQCRNIIDNNDISDISQYEKKRPPIFMVCAAPSSGKKTLMEIIGDLGNIYNNIKITSKYAQRDARSTDGRDGMIAIGREGRFEDYINGDKTIWKWPFHKSDAETWYAVNKLEIDKNIKDGIAQVFISNMEQIKAARDFYPDNIVVLYLHAAHETETRKHIELKARDELIKQIRKDCNCTVEEARIIIKNNRDYSNQLKKNERVKAEEIKNVHEMFPSYNHQIDHVLLNTGTKEDLVNQMEKLIEYYTNFHR